ncbi:histidine phosphatase family protein [Nonomuraea sp. MCN248]|uniref:Histidine phosphatase family protein n=1 Tax=Nonomuraea corallina TaxID=2989783 RepID=A0ABT4SAE2_9ACTN|nr:histidine phosphatase family protein [Nonomuraea corallina]MDA0633911.1 histidine phosphatase family protein [Nonomuraea corallina]
MGPRRILAVRHGESEANVAYRRAGARPLVYERGDDEVGLSELGRVQSAALGAMLARLPAGEAPELVWCSPYRRALDTWAVARATWGAEPPVTVDARLRDREWGALAPYNEAAIAERFPGERARWRAEGEYRYRPPGGESFGDVAARLRGVLDDLREHADGRRVLIVAHDAVVLVLRHVLDATPDTDLPGLAAFAPILNASVSTWDAEDGHPRLLGFNTVHHL